MIVALLVTLSGTAFTGWLMEEPDAPRDAARLPPIVARARPTSMGEERKAGVSGPEWTRLMVLRLRSVIARTSPAPWSPVTDARPGTTATYCLNLGLIPSQGPLSLMPGLSLALPAGPFSS